VTKRTGRAHGEARRSLVLAILAFAALLAACGTALQGGPLGPCGDDAKAAGGFPELEALLPATLGPGGPAPNVVDSRRSCSDMALTTLKAHGVTELRAAGATWEYSKSEATLIAVLATPTWVPSLEAAWVEEWYEQGARAGKKTDNIDVSRPLVDPVGEVFWLDTVNDLSFQTVVTWQAGGLTHVVIVASDVAPLRDIAAHEEKVVAAVRAAGGMSAPPPGSLPPGVSPGCGCTPGLPPAT
jgi:hypothetical protein